MPLAIVGLTRCLSCCNKVFRRMVLDDNLPPADISDSEPCPPSEGFPGLAQLPFTLEDVRRSVSLKPFESGQAYYGEGRVTLEDVEPDGSGLEGLVQGSRAMPYRVFVTIKEPSHTGPEGRTYPIIEGDCSCPVGYNCKHAAALMMLALGTQNAARNPTSAFAPLDDEAGDATPLTPFRVVSATPVPHLTLLQRALQPSPYRQRQGYVEARAVPLARLTFLYDGIEVTNDHDSPTATLMVGSDVVNVKRSSSDERLAQTTLSDLGFERLADRNRWQIPPDCRHDLTLFVGSGDDNSEQWLDFLSLDLPRLRERGWQISLADDFPYHLVKADEVTDDDGNRLGISDLEAEVLVADGPTSTDWFELAMGVMIAGERVDILPALLHVLGHLPADGLGEFLDDASNDEDVIYLRLPDQRILPLTFGRIRPILRTLSDVFNGEPPAPGPVRLSTSHAAALAELEAVGNLRWRGDDRLRRLGRRLRNPQALSEIVVPSIFNGALRPYQLAGLGWLQLLRDVGLGGVLADDMGLGKTVQVLAHVAAEKASGRLDRPILVVAPTSLMPNWKAEAATFTPSLSVVVQHGIGRLETAESLKSFDMVLTTYALLARDVALLGQVAWHMVIVDEAQFIKNPATAAAKALRHLDTRHRLAMTGTPLENHLGELWALFDFVSSGFLGDAKGFLKNWRSPIEKRGDPERQKQLARRVKPFLLRRSKADVAADLPPKVEMSEAIDLGPAQRALYEGIRLTMHSRIREAIAEKGLSRSRIELLDALLKLRQACCDPRLVKTPQGRESRAASAKLERLMEMVPELIEEGRRILLFSQFTSMLDLIEAEVKRLKIPFVRLDGQTRDRATPVKSFQAGDVPLFLISLKAGGTGLNLTAADTVIHYDPWWNPAVEAQATDRAHRIGQDKTVFVYKLVALDTIEVKMAALKARKQALADGLYDPDNGSALDITEADVEFLLGAV